MAVGTNEDGKSTIGLRDKLRPSILAVYQDKYDRWDCLHRDAKGELSENKFFQLLHILHGDNGSSVGDFFVAKLRCSQDTLARPGASCYES